MLLVEDEEMSGSAVVQTLHDAAYAVDWVADGAQASAVLERHDFELVLLDLGLCPIATAWRCCRGCVPTR